MRGRPFAFCVTLALATLAGATDVPVAARRLELRATAAKAEKRSATLSVRDRALAAPFPDPTLGAALVVNGGAAPGQCRAEILLDPAKWRPIGGDGTRRGYLYLDDKPGTQGVLRIMLRPGALVVSARGGGWPCDLAADAERLPVSVVLRVSDMRYCAAFGGAVKHNEAGRFTARCAPAPAACPDADLTVADLNILHGIFCPVPTQSCRLAERIELLFQWIAASGCPDVVTLQEVSDTAEPLITAHLADACPFPYQRVFVRAFGVDDEMILSRYPAVTSESHRLYKNFRHLLFARLDHPIGPVDVFTTHLASSSDGAQLACSADCPPECVSAGAATVRQCQGVQVAGFVEARHDVPTPAVVTGDFNESPGTFVYDQLAGRGWPDTYLAAGNPECVPATGVGCTSGRVDDALSELESPVSNEDERIDFIFLVPPGSGSVCAGAIDSGADNDGDGTATRIFADDPTPFAPTCGPAPEAICWPSDHEGAELDLNCH
jgi:endonuclease/exonuclease/phosphatase family metal-dependent hydrolase